jgi:hypothetical protein
LRKNNRKPIASVIKTEFRKGSTKCLTPTADDNGHAPKKLSIIEYRKWQDGSIEFMEEIIATNDLARVYVQYGLNLFKICFLTIDKEIQTRI